MSEFLAAAHARAAHGWRVLPCWPRAKSPLSDLVPNGLHGATTDPAVIDRWWRMWPDANVAIATGAPGPDVLDVDVKEEGNGFAAFNRLKRCGLLAGAATIVRTRNDGLHLYFAGTDQPSGRLPRQHLDFKACGGYVLAPPSIVPPEPWATGAPGRYSLLDHRQGDHHLDWAAVCRLLEPPDIRAPRRYVTSGGRGGIAALVRWLETQPNGNRNNALFWASCQIFRKGLDEQVEELFTTATAIGLEPREARATVESARRTIGRAA